MALLVVGAAVGVAVGRGLRAGRLATAHLAAGHHGARAPPRVRRASGPRGSPTTGSSRSTWSAGPSSAWSGCPSWSCARPPPRPTARSTGSLRRTPSGSGPASSSWPASMTPSEPILPPPPATARPPGASPPRRSHRSGRRPARPAAAHQPPHRRARGDRPRLAGVQRHRRRAPRRGRRRHRDLARPRVRRVSPRGVVVPPCMQEPPPREAIPDEGRARSRSGRSPARSTPRMALTPSQTRAITSEASVRGLRSPGSSMRTGGRRRRERRGGPRGRWSRRRRQDGSGGVIDPGQLEQAGTDPLRIHRAPARTLSRRSWRRQCARPAATARRLGSMGPRSRSICWIRSSGPAAVRPARPDEARGPWCPTTRCAASGCPPERQPHRHADDRPDDRAPRGTITAGNEGDDFPDMPIRPSRCPAAPVARRVRARGSVRNSV